MSHKVQELEVSGPKASREGREMKSAEKGSVATRSQISASKNVTKISKDLITVKQDWQKEVEQLQDAHLQLHSNQKELQDQLHSLMEGSPEGGSAPNNARMNELVSVCEITQQELRTLKAMYEEMAKKIEFLELHGMNS